jgi:hypothetical protein
VNTSVNFWLSCGRTRFSGSLLPAVDHPERTTSHELLNLGTTTLVNAS